MKRLRFRIATVFVLTAVVGFNCAVVPLGLFPAYAASIVTVSALVTYFARFTFHHRQLAAAFRGVIAAMLWAGVLLAAVTIYRTHSFVSGIFVFASGAGLGFLIGMIPATLFGLIPESKTRYFGERDPRPDNVVSIILPYIGGSGG